MKFKITLRSSIPTSKLIETIEVDADDIEEAKRRGHTLIAMQKGKTYPMPGVSVEAEEI